MPDARRPFSVDLEKYYRIHFGTASPPLRSRARLWLAHSGLHCVAVFRMGKAARRLARRRPIVGWIPLQIARALDLAMGLVHHVEICAEVGPGFYIGHASTIYVGPTRIGSNCSMTHNVTIGVGHSEFAAGTPTPVFWSIAVRPWMRAGMDGC